MTGKRRKGRKPVLPRRMTPDERKAFVMAWCNGDAVTSRHVPERLLTQVFMPLGLCAFDGWRDRDIQQIGLVWADRSRDTTTGWAVNGFPMFVSCRLMLLADWQELRPEIEKELDRRAKLIV